MRALVSVVVMVATMTTSAMAEGPRLPDECAAGNITSGPCAVALCVQDVKKIHPNFDAYLSSNGTTVKFFGTKRERFAFEKCMDQAGFPMESK